MCGMDNAIAYVYVYVYTFAFSVLQADDAINMLLRLHEQFAPVRNLIRRYQRLRLAASGLWLGSRSKTWLRKGLGPDQ